jgi:DNA modification methylase
VIPYYEHTGITIYHGDCREWFHTAAPKSLGLVATDPPYGVGIEYASYKDDLQTTTSLVLRFVEMAEPVARCIAFSVGKFDTELALYQKRPPRWRMCWYKGAQTTATTRMTGSTPNPSVWAPSAIPARNRYCSRGR